MCSFVWKVTFVLLLLGVLLVEEVCCQKGGAKAGMRRGGRGGGGRGRGGGVGNRAEEGMEEWEGNGSSSSGRRPCVGICYLRSTYHM